jgi:hypothetical protein
MNPLWRTYTVYLSERTEHLCVKELVRKMSSHYGNGQLDLLDWVPLFAVILAAALIFNSLIPASVIGRGLARKDEDMLGKTATRNILRDPRKEDELSSLA